MSKRGGGGQIDRGIRGREEERGVEKGEREGMEKKRLKRGSSHDYY